MVLDALFARISQSTSKAPLKLKANKQQKRKSVNTVTDKEKDFLFKAMLADMGIFLEESSKGIYFLKEDNFWFFKSKQVIGIYNKKRHKYEINGYPATNHKIYNLLCERYNTEPKPTIVFFSDDPRPMRTMEWDFML